MFSISAFLYPKGGKNYVSAWSTQNTDQKQCTEGGAFLMH